VCKEQQWPHGRINSLASQEWIVSALRRSGGEPRKSVTLEHLAEVFGADGQNVLKRKAAVERLEDVAGIGRTAAYDALKADGPFGAYLDDTGEGLRFKAPSDA
jgi:3-methyladenine DNA glycosylase/8-oxoguanine DNA glycosylase